MGEREKRKRDDGGKIQQERGVVKKSRRGIKNPQGDKKISVEHRYFD